MAPCIGLVGLATRRICVAAVPASCWRGIPSTHPRIVPQHQPSRAWVGAAFRPGAGARALIGGNHAPTNTGTWRCYDGMLYFLAAKRNDSERRRLKKTVHLKNYLLEGE